MSVCQFFLSDAGCSFGADCRLAHISPPRQQQQQQDQQQDQQPQRPSSSRHRGTRGPADAAAQRPQSAGRGRGRGRGQAQGRGQQLARGAGGAAAGPAPDSVHSAAQNRQPQQTASGSRPGSSRSRQHKRPQQQAAAVDAPQADQREPEPAPASAPAPSTPPAPVRAPPVSRPAVARPVPKSLAARLQETTDPIDRSRLTRELELSQLERRFRPTKYAIQPSPMVSLSGPAPPTVIDIDLIPSDPDFPYDLEALHVRLSVPALYPTDPVCRLEVLNDEIPGPLRRNVERGWAKKMAASRTGLLAMINWLDTNLERLFVQRDDDEGMIRSFQSGVGSASGSVAPSSTGATAGDEDDNDAGQSGDEDEDKALDRGTPDGDGSGRPFGFGVNVTKEEIARLAGDIEDVLDMDGPQQQQQQQSDSHDTDDHELDGQDGSDGELPSMDGDGDALMKAGSKALSKTSFFGKAKPDYEEALTSFEQAANAFRNARVYDRAAEAFQKVSECHMANNSLFLAAKALETAANLYAQNLNDPHRAGPVYQQASQVFVAQGSADRAGEMLEKAAKAFETVNVDKAIEFYTEACGVYEDEGRLRFGVDTYKRAVSFCLRSQRFDTGLALSTRLEDAYLKIDNLPSFTRQGLSNIVLLLSVGNESASQVKFDELCRKSGRWSQSEDGKVANDLIVAFQTGDAQLLEDIQRSSPLRFLDNDIAKIAKTLRAPAGRSASGGGGPAPMFGAAAPFAPAPASAPEQGSAYDHAPQRGAATPPKDLHDEIEEEGFM
ncbi:soluble NSF attachment protein [Entophlyctis helioformis]|nr:soluble NSF attachment protein [Entophlyctis helioformis]